MAQEFSQTVRHLLGAYEARREAEAAERRRAQEAAEERRRARREALKSAVVPTVNEAAKLLQDAGHAAHVVFREMDGGVILIVRPKGGKRRADGPVPFTLSFDPVEDDVAVSAVYGERDEGNPFLEDQRGLGDLTPEWAEELVARFLETALDH